MPRPGLSSSRLIFDKNYSVGNAGPRGAVGVDLVATVCIAERNTAHHAAVVANSEMLAHDAGINRQRRLRHRGETKRLRRQHEIIDVAAAIDGAVDAER